ncbi:MAG: histidine phosphatase family protein [Acidimicrobiales bacterium]
MLILVRHGRTAANAAGLLQGRVDNPLDEVGVAQAEALGRVIGGGEVVVASPLLRARQTAEAIAAGAPVELDERFLELDYGAFDGVPTREVPAEVWDRWRRDPSFAPPGGETLEQLQRRVNSGLDAWAERAVAADVVVVTHVSPIKAAFSWALGLGPELSWRTFVAPASITRIAIGPRGPVLHSFNETPAASAAV